MQYASVTKSIDNATGGQSGDHARNHCYVEQLFIKRLLSQYLVTPNPGRNHSKSRFPRPLVLAPAGF